MVRCFVGFLLPEYLRSYISDVQSKLKNIEMDCKFVEAENMHVCFSFLGDIDERSVKNVLKLIDSIDSECVEVGLGNIKLIPNENYFRVVVIDVVDKSGKLDFLLKNIVGKVGGDSKPLHITLCRVKNVSDKSKVVEKIKEIRIDGRKFVVDKIQLIKSELNSDGPVYSVLHEKHFSA